MTTEKDIIEQIEAGKLLFPPLAFRLLQVQPEIAGNRRFDALVEGAWGSAKQNSPSK